MKDKVQEVDWDLGMRVVAGVLSVGCLFFPTGVVTDRLEMNFHADHVTTRRMHLFDDASFELFARHPNWHMNMNILSGLIAAGCLTNVYLLTAPCMQVAAHARGTPRDESIHVYPTLTFAIISMVCTSVIALCVGLFVHSLHIDGGKNAVDTRIASGAIFGLMGALFTTLPTLALELRSTCFTEKAEPSDMVMGTMGTPVQWNPGEWDRGEWDPGMMEETYF
tara:strand:- start:29313 stop:29978 length:666 start_codon:yes stop_codon:yes gene_type:complete